MYQIVTESAFIDAFENMGRADNFSNDGLRALFNFIEETNDNTQLDVVALCSEYSEYESATEAAKEYGIEGDPDDDGIDPDPEAQAEAAEAYFLRDLQDSTIVIEFDGGIIIQDF